MRSAHSPTSGSSSIAAMSRFRALRKPGIVNGVVTASIPNPRTQLKPFAPPPSSRCDLEVRASDSKMADSNTLKTTVDFK